jgi:urease beta subunit
MNIIRMGTHLHFLNINHMTTFVTRKTVEIQLCYLTIWR